MKVEFNKEPLKKTPTEIKLKMEILGGQRGTSEVSLTKRLEDAEERISGLEDKVEGKTSSVKENVKFENTQAKNIQEIWDTMRRQNLR